MNPMNDKTSSRLIDPRIALLLLAGLLVLVLLVRAVPSVSGQTRADGPAPDPLPVQSDEGGGLTLGGSMGHSHNDYYRDKPLEDALDAGMLSIEADVILRDDELFIAHDPHEIRADRTLRSLYLEPLKRAFIKQGARDKDHPFNGKVRADGVPVILMIDFKSDGEKSWRLLEKQLAAYAPMLRRVRVSRNGEASVNEGPVIVVISGNRPIELMAEATSRFCSVDGRYPQDAGSTAPAHLMPMISNSWSTLKRHAGGDDPAAVDGVLRAMRDDAAKHGRVARVWATPDNQAMWSRLAGLNMQLVNTDRPAELAAFFARQTADATDGE